MPQIDKKILIVEDEPPELSVLLQKISQAGFETFGAKNSQEALDSVAKENPDLVLLDLILPGMNGIEVIKTIRAEHQMPIIVLTNISEAEKAKEAISAGANLYLVKTDWTLSEVIAKIKEWLKID